MVLIPARNSFRTSSFCGKMRSLSLSRRTLELMHCEPHLPFSIKNAAISAQASVTASEGTPCPLIREVILLQTILYMSLDYL